MMADPQLVEPSGRIESRAPDSKSWVFTLIKGTLSFEINCFILRTTRNINLYISRTAGTLFDILRSQDKIYHSYELDHLRGNAFRFETNQLSSNREQPREIKKKKRCYSNALNFLLHGQKEGLVHFFSDRAPQGQQQVLSGEKFHYKDNEFYHLLYLVP